MYVRQNMRFANTRTQMIKEKKKIKDNSIDHRKYLMLVKIHLTKSKSQTWRKHTYKEGDSVLHVKLSHLQSQNFSLESSVTMQGSNSCYCQKIIVSASPNLRHSDWETPPGIHQEKKGRKKERKRKSFFFKKNYGSIYADKEPNLTFYKTIQRSHKSE